MLDKPLLEQALSAVRKFQSDASSSVSASHPTVREVLKRMSALPTGSMLVGAGEDGLPFLLDLDQPASGALLLCGDPGCGKTRLMQSMAVSLPVMNSSRECRYAVITARPDEWKEKVIQPQCLGVYDVAGEEAPRLVIKLLALAEQRNEQNSSSGPAFVIFVDDLMAVQSWDQTAQVNLHWLIQYGALSRVWIVAGAAAQDALEIPYWIDAFRTRLIGHITEMQTAEAVAIHAGLDAGTIHAKNQFAIWFEDQWQIFRAPEPGSPILKDEVRDEYRHVMVR